MNIGSLASTAVKANQLGVNLSSGLGAPGQSAFTKNNLSGLIDSGKSAKSALGGLTVKKTLEGLKNTSLSNTKNTLSFSEHAQNNNLQSPLNSMGILSKRI